MQSNELRKPQIQRQNSGESLKQSCILTYSRLHSQPREPECLSPRYPSNVLSLFCVP